MPLQQMVPNYMAQPYSASGAAQTNTATIPAVAGKTAYIEGFDLGGGGATAASVIAVTVTGILNGTLTYNVAIIAGATLAAFSGGAILSVRFPTPLPASGLNTAIAVVVPSYGAGNTAASVVAYGFYMLPSY